MERLLIVDDEAGIRDILSKYASFAGYRYATAADGTEAIALVEKEAFDLIILDIAMPGMDGFATCRMIRKSHQTPILMLSAHGEEYDRIQGFEAGADDFVVKPFSPRELMMRVGAILRRSQGAAKAAPEQRRDVLNLDGLTIDFSGRLVQADGKHIALTPKECDLLFFLVRNRGVALNRTHIINVVWGYDFTGDERTLDTHMKLLRRKLGVYGQLIETLRGVGYRFDG